MSVRRGLDRRKVCRVECQKLIQFESSELFSIQFTLSNHSFGAQWVWTSLTLEDSQLVLMRHIAETAGQVSCKELIK